MKTYRIYILSLLCLYATVLFAQNNSDRIMFGAGALYEKGFDVTLSWEHETEHHNAWEYFLNAYLKYADDPLAGHVTSDSFWNNYNTWSGGVAYKMCVVRCKNSYGTIRLGGSIGSDTYDFKGWINLGYEHDYALRHGWQLFWQVKTDFGIGTKDLLRSGVVLGIKVPLSKF